MNAQKGFIMVKDPSTGKMIPFFVKVRAKDIITDNSNNSKDLVTGIPELKNTSAQWKLVNVFKSIDTVSYVYEQVDLSSMTIGSKDANGETVCNYINSNIPNSVSTIVYEISSSGLYHVYGTLCTKNYSNANSNTPYIYKWHLPYSLGSKIYSKLFEPDIIAFDDNNAIYHTTELPPSWMEINSISIENQKLAGTDITSYLYEICVDIWQGGFDLSKRYGIFNIDIRGKI